MLQSQLNQSTVLSLIEVFESANKPSGNQVFLQRSGISLDTGLHEPQTRNYNTVT
jgi:hypothetical protein